MSTLSQRSKPFSASFPFQTSSLTLEETEWFEYKPSQPLGYVREPRYPVQCYYSENMQEQIWTAGYYPPANFWAYGAYDYTSLRTGPLQPTAYQEFPMTQQPRIQHPPCKLSVVPPKDTATDNTNKAPAPAKPKKQPQQQLLQLTPLSKAKDNAPKPDFDSVLAAAAKPPASTEPSPKAPSKESDQGDVFPCPVPRCSKSYRRRCRVIEHVRRRHYHEGAPMFRCLEPKCEKIFDVLKELKSHQCNESHSKEYAVLFNDEKKSDRPAEPVTKRVKTDEVPPDGSTRFHCKLCSKSFCSKYRRDIHAAVCSGNGDDKVFRCAHPGCPKAYATKDSLIRHFRVASHGGKEGKETQSSEEKKKEEEADSTNRVQELVDLFDEI